MVLHSYFGTLRKLFFFMTKKLVLTVKLEDKYETKPPRILDALLFPVQVQHRSCVHSNLRSFLSEKITV